jgi:flavin-dependent dehydrogenase
VFDVAIIGGGPAGSTAARLLAQWGHSVAILNAPPPHRHSLAECLPPSTCKLFQFLGIQDAIERAGFFPTSGNTVWWGKNRRRVEPYPGGWGYQVVRSEFDRLLLELSEAAGAHIHIGKACAVRRTIAVHIEVQSGAKRTPIRAKFLMDCSGRATVLSRLFHWKQNSFKTVALCGIWRNESSWRLPDASHTLVEAYGDGWAWSVPVSPFIRYVAFMVDPTATRMIRGKGLGEAYLAELAKTRAFRTIFSRGSLESAPWGRDASLYTSRQFCGPGFLLAGDAGAFIDPLSSFGVKKAMASAWVGAVVANTWLGKPEMRQIALQFFEDRERQIANACLKQSAAWFRKASGRFANPFWELRSEEPAVVDASGDRDDGSETALDQLRRKASIQLRRADGVRIEPRPGIEGREIILRDTLVAPGGGGLDFLANVNLARLVELAEHHSQVPDLFDAYNRTGPPVSLPNFLTALAALVARKILVGAS